MRHLLILAIAASFAGGTQSFAQTPPAVYEIHLTASPPAINGLLDDAAWEKAPNAAMVRVEDGTPPPQPTSVQLLWDDTYLYIGLYAVDPDAWTTYTKDDDDLWEAEVFECFIDPDGRGQTYYEINFSPAGNVVDLFVTHATKLRGFKFVSMREWDCIGLKHAVHVEGDPAPGTVDKSWSVEVAIPFDQLWTAQKLRPQPGDEWRANFFRIDRNPKDPADRWQACFSKGGFHVPWQFGRLLFTE